MLRERLITRLHRAVARQLFGRTSTRRLMNDFYLKLEWAGRKRFWERYAKIYRNREVAVDSGVWRTEIGGRQLIVPLQQDTIWLDWDTAASICGHNVDVKITYEYILGSDRKPDLFLDIGANYGTHSLIFLVHGVRTVSFEPNTDCEPIFKALCAANGVEPDMRTLAVGAKSGKAILQFQPQDTWFGSVVSEDKAGSQTSGSRRSIDVVPLDQYRDWLEADSILMKIDVEGHELEVFKGSRQLIADKRPVIIFECAARDSVRFEIFDFLGTLGYRITDLPFNPDSLPDVLSRAGFDAARKANFAAFPDSYTFERN